MPRHPTSGRPASAATRHGRARAAWWLARAAGALAAVGALVPAVLAAPDGNERAVASLAFGAALAWWAVVVEVIRSDLARYVIPDEASAAIAALGVAVAAGGAWLSGEDVASAAAAARAAIETGAGAFGVFWLTGFVFRRWGRDALGFGDVKLAGASAVWLAPADAALALEIAALAAIVALLLEQRRGARVADTAVPFGAFLAPSAWAVHLLAPRLRDLWDFGT